MPSLNRKRQNKPPSRDDKYWRLPEPDPCMTKEDIRLELQNKGYKPGVSLPREGLLRIIQHEQLDYICYEKCKEQELRKFATSRGLLSMRAKGCKPRLINLLLKADMDSSFHRFTDLPAELRVRIYEIYVANLTQGALRQPTDPPLTRVSRLLRSEALPIFYRACKFAIQLTSTMDSATNPLSLDPAFENFLTSLSIAKLGHIRSFEIFIRLVIELLRSDQLLVRVRITFDAAMSSYTINLTPGECLSGQAFKEDGCAAVLAKFEEVGDKVVARASPWKLRAEDLLQLCDPAFRLQEALNKGL